MSLHDQVHTLSVLTAKALAGTLTEAERAELTTLTSAVAAATAPVDLSKVRTKLTTVKFSDFQKAIADLQAQADPDPLALALARDNALAVKDQAPAGPDAVVAVRVLDPVAAPAVLDPAEERIAALEEQVKGLTSKAVNQMVSTGAPVPPATPAEAAAKGTVAQSLATEAMDAVLLRFQALQQALTAGTLTTEELNKQWPDWDLKHMIEMCVTLQSKAAAMKSAVDAVLPSLEALAAPADPSGDASTDADAPPPPAAPAVDKAAVHKLRAGQSFGRRLSEAEILEKLAKQQKRLG